LEKFFQHFRRDAAGAWICVSPAELMLPQGRVQVSVGSRFARGTRFMNVDLAELLEAEHRRRQDLP
jgi:hypothetical protein